MGDDWGDRLQPEPATSSDHRRPAAGTPAVTKAIAELGRSYAFESLPAPIVARARHCFLDWLGVTIAGAEEPAARMARELALTEAGPRQATLIGAPERTGLTQAALVNGTASHALDFDDVSAHAGGHPSVPVFPALLALAERDDASGRDFLTAFVSGFETEGRIGLLVAPGHYAAGWHATATIGTFGAAAAVAHLLSLDSDRWRMALGIAGTQAAGLKSMFGTMCKPLHAGKAAANGILAGLLAERGFTSNPDVLETEQGFGWTQTTTFSPERALQELRGRFAIAGVAFKRHAACFGTHSAIEGILQLRHSQHLRPTDVQRVLLHVPPALMSMCNIPEPRTGLEGKFSLRFTAALALAGGDTSNRGFTDDRVRDPELVSLAERVSVEPVADKGAQAPTDITVIRRDGTQLSTNHNVYEPTSDDDLPAEWEALVAKFRALAEPVIGPGAATSVVEYVSTLENVASMRMLAGLTVLREKVM